MTPVGAAPDGAVSCPFCDIGEQMSTDVFSLKPLNPVIPGHMLVVSKRHVRDAGEDPDVTAEVMRVAAGLANTLRPANIITSLGAAASQTVFHLHVHVLPRHEGDGLRLPWG